MGLRTLHGRPLLFLIMVAALQPSSPSRTANRSLRLGFGRKVPAQTHAEAAAKGRGLVDKLLYGTENEVDEVSVGGLPPPPEHTKRRKENQGNCSLGEKTWLQVHHGS